MWRISLRARTENKKKENKILAARCMAKSRRSSMAVIENH